MSVYLLDDGFQHRRLGRDLDMVLLTAADMEDVLLPAGNLREPLGALRQADVVVLREEELAGRSGWLRRLCARARGMPLVWVIRRRLGASRVRGAGAGRWCFAGIARPEGFVAMLEEEGCTAVEDGAFRRSSWVYGGGCGAVGGGGEGAWGGRVCDDGEGCGEADGGDDAAAGEWWRWRSCGWSWWMRRR